MRKSSTTKNRPFEISPEQTVRELVVTYPSLRPDLERLGIDYCCGGERPLSEAVKDAGLEWDDAAGELKQAWIAAAQTEAPATDWNKAPLAALIPNLKVEVLGTVLHKGLPDAETFAQLDELAATVAEKHAAL